MNVLISEKVTTSLQLAGLRVLPVRERERERQSADSHFNTSTFSREKLNISEHEMSHAGKTMFGQ